ncbi:hypothetical protein Q7C36_007042 [Tachysurus vachellii]|uniref:Uncharacterized protein n=1 Tax=Tachysurus vachellii TaxID=175792 RepID=A0AA88NAP0_TACVA|nr:hypothetical protein Q7C36_007042 [Tachysurus vachellii]
MKHCVMRFGVMRERLHLARPSVRGLHLFFTQPGKRAQDKDAVVKVTSWTDSLPVNIYHLLRSLHPG